MSTPCKRWSSFTSNVIALEDMAKDILRTNTLFIAVFKVQRYYFITLPAPSGGHNQRMAPTGIGGFSVVFRHKWMWCTRVSIVCWLNLDGTYSNHAIHIFLQEMMTIECFKIITKSKVEVEHCGEHEIHSHLVLYCWDSLGNKMRNDDLPRTPIMIMHHLCSVIPQH